MLILVGPMGELVAPMRTVLCDTVEGGGVGWGTMLETGRVICVQCVGCVLKSVTRGYELDAGGRSFAMEGARQKPYGSGEGDGI